MINEQSTWFLLAFCTVCLIVAGVCELIYFDNASEELMKIQSSNIMLHNFGSYDFKESYVAGYYNPQKKFYCVATKGFSREDIMNNDAHERCHSFVDEEYEHFCEGVN